MHQLAPLDVAIVVAYFAATVLLGAWFARRQRDTSTYFVGGRNVGGWLILVSVVAGFMRVLFWLMDEEQGLVKRRQKRVEEETSTRALIRHQLEHEEQEHHH